MATVDLARILAEEAPVDLLKLDIEGAELEVLTHCREALREVDHLFVEYHGRHDEPQRLDELLALLRAAGFRYHLRNASRARQPFVEQPLTLVYDQLADIFAYRRANPRHD